MQLILVRTIPASGNRDFLLRLSPDHLRIRINTLFRYSYVGSMSRHFRDKIKKLNVSEISIELLSELIVSVSKTDQAKSSAVHDFQVLTLVTNTKVAETISVSSILCMNIAHMI